MPIMPVIEVFSALMKPVSLTIRLFANMLAGHIMILSVVCVIFIMAKYGPVLTGSMTVVSVLFGLFLDALESDMDTCEEMWAFFRQYLK